MMCKHRSPLHVKLDERTKTAGVVLCEHLRSLDLAACGYVYVESLPADVLDKVLQIVLAELE